MHWLPNILYRTWHEFLIFWKLYANKLHSNVSLHHNYLAQYSVSALWVRLILRLLHNVLPCMYALVLRCTQIKALRTKVVTRLCLRLSQRRLLQISALYSNRIRILTGSPENENCTEGRRCMCACVVFIMEHKRGLAAGDNKESTVVHTLLNKEQQVTLKGMWHAYFITPRTSKQTLPNLTNSPRQPGLWQTQIARDKRTQYSPPPWTIFVRTQWKQFARELAKMQRTT